MNPPVERAGAATRRRWWREPAVHFVVLGAVLFAGHRALGGTRGWGADDAPVVVRAETVSALASGLERDLGRAPTDAELDVAVQAFVDRELLVREARRLGLERDDPVVRRRLVQKLQMVHEDLGPSQLPSEAELRAHVRAHPERYALAERVDLRHHYFSTARHEDPTASARRAVAAHTAASGDTDTADTAEVRSDPFPHGDVLRGRSRSQLDAAFGPGFGDAAFELTPGRWSVLPSSYGAHAVLVERVVATRAPAFEAVRNRALSDVLEARRTQARARALEELRARSHWTVEGRP